MEIAKKIEHNRTKYIDTMQPKMFAQALWMDGACSMSQLYVRSPILSFMIHLSETIVGFNMFFLFFLSAT